MLKGSRALKTQGFYWFLVVKTSNYIISILYIYIYFYFLSSIDDRYCNGSESKFKTQPQKFDIRLTLLVLSHPSCGTEMEPSSTDAQMSDSGWMR